MSQSHLWMTHVTYTNGSCHIYEWVMSLMNQSYHIIKSVMSHTWFSYVGSAFQFFLCCLATTRERKYRSFVPYGIFDCDIPILIYPDGHTDVTWAITYRVLNPYDICDIPCDIRIPIDRTFFSRQWIELECRRWVLPRIRMCGVTRANESRHTHEWVISSVQMSHVHE
jgi:hypothetical protein